MLFKCTLCGEGGEEAGGGGDTGGGGGSDSGGFASDNDTQPLTSPPP